MSSSVGALFRRESGPSGAELEGLGRLRGRVATMERAAAAAGTAANAPARGGRAVAAVAAAEAHPVAAFRHADVDGNGRLTLQVLQ